MLEANLQVLSFLLNQQEYALPIRHIMRVVRMVAITPAPNTPPTIEGVVNLGGSVVPVINMRVRLGFPRTLYNTQNHLIFVKTNARIMGIIVDHVREVLTLTPDQLNNVDEMGADIAQYLSAVGKLQDRLLLILAPDSLLSMEEARQLQYFMREELPQPA